VRGETLEERKRFARELAARDALRNPHTTPAMRLRMRRWWLERYTMDEIREMGHCLVGDRPVS
jgi:hypothetical protein